MWPDCPYPIYLNTEDKNYNHSVLKVQCVHPIDIYTNKKKTHIIKWGERLIQVLNQIDSKYVLMFLEDFFLKSPVRSDMIEKCLCIMDDNEKIACMRLKNNTYYEDELLFEEFSEVRKNWQYIVTTQVAVWRKDFLIEILRKNESAFDFEFYGSGRFNKIYSKQGYKILAHRSGFPPICDYEFEVKYGYGIVQGKWLEHNKELFKKNNIKVNFYPRGFYGEECATDNHFVRKKENLFINTIKHIRYSSLGNRINKKWIYIRRDYFNR